MSLASQLIQKCPARSESPTKRDPAALSISARRKAMQNRAMERKKHSHLLFSSRLAAAVSN
jgi:hypothetical protein